MPGLANCPHTCQTFIASDSHQVYYPGQAMAMVVRVTELELEPKEEPADRPA